MKDTSITLKGKIWILVKSLLFICLFMALLAVGALLQMMLPIINNKLMYGILGTIGALIAVWIFLKAEKQPYNSVNLVWERKTLLRFLYGLIIGTVIFIIVVLPLFAFSNLTIKFDTSGFHCSSLMLYVTLVPLALMEEIGFRSYPQVRLHKTFGVWTSQIVVAIAFGIYHVLNGWGLYGSFTGPFVWAFVFGLAAIWSRGIAMPTGIHLALNILQNLAGLKGGKDAILKLDYPTGTPQAIMDKTGHIGLAMQIVVLVAALIVTWWYAKKPSEPEFTGL
jgi:membrane protease YdiL (CAAX protease family)